MTRTVVDKEKCDRKPSENVLHGAHPVPAHVKWTPKKDGAGSRNWGTYTDEPHNKAAGGWDERDPGMGESGEIHRRMSAEDAAAPSVAKHGDSPAASDSPSAGSA